MTEWILCVCRPGCETAARTYLKQHDLAVVLPTSLHHMRPRGRQRYRGQRAQMVESALWSGYCIVGAEQIPWEKMRLIFRDRASYLQRPVMFGGKVVRLSQRLVDELLQMRWADDSGLKINDRVRIKDGPLAELEGNVIDVGDEQVAIVVDMLGAAKVKLGRHWLRVA